MRVLESNLKAEAGNATVYIDARTLGSSAQFTDTTRPLGQRCLALFRDIMLPVRDALLEYICENPTDASERATEALREFELALTGTNSDHQNSEIRLVREGGTRAELPLGVGGVHIGGNSSATTIEETKYSTHLEDKVVFPDLHAAL